MEYASVLASVAIMFVLDGIFAFATKEVNDNMLRKMIPTFRFLGIAGFYTILHTGLWYFILLHHLSPLDAFWLGLFTYGVSEFSNYTILTNWRWYHVVMNTVWGGVLFALTTWLTYKVEEMLPGRET